MKRVILLLLFGMVYPAWAFNFAAFEYLGRGYPRPQNWWFFGSLILINVIVSAASIRRLTHDFQLAGLIVVCVLQLGPTALWTWATILDIRDDRPQIRENGYQSQLAGGFAVLAFEVGQAAMFLPIVVMKIINYFKADAAAAVEAQLGNK